MKRSEVREWTFKLMYSLEIQKDEEIDSQIELFLENNEITNKEAIEYIKDCIYGVKKYEGEIIENIKNSLTSDWKIERISKINLSLLKLAIYEIKYKKIPYKAEINEVVELAKTYGEEMSSKFINGALAKIVKEMQMCGQILEN